jgi:hypothetical protein
MRCRLWLGRFLLQRLGGDLQYLVQIASAQYVQGTVFLGFVVGSEEFQYYPQILSSPPKNNQPSGACVQYRAVHGTAPHAERGSFELPSIIRNIFQHHLQNFRLNFPYRFACYGRGLLKSAYLHVAAQSPPFWGCVLSTSPATLRYWLAS